MNQIEIGKNNTEFLLVKLQYNILGRGTLWIGAHFGLVVGYKVAIHMYKVAHVFQTRKFEHFWSLEQRSKVTLRKKILIFKMKINCPQFQLKRL
jgi:hypothetical protein